MQEKPQPTHFTIKEGGDWKSWSDKHHREGYRNAHGELRFHSIKFSDGSIFDMVNGWRPNELDLKIKAAVAAFEALSPEEQEAHRYEQKRSFVRGMCPSNRDYEEWCKLVDKSLPPKPRY